MTEESIHIFHRLNNSNYRLWKFNVDAVLKGHGLLSIVQGKSKLEATLSEEKKELWMKRDGKAMGILISSIEKDEANHVLSCTTSNELYEKLQAVHDKQSEVKVMCLYEEYFSLKMQEDESVAAYVSKVSSLAAEIEAQGEKLSENIKMVRIISSLPQKYQNFKTVWYNIKEGRTIENLMAKLQLEEDQLKKNNDAEVTEAAFNVKSEKPKKSIAERKKTSRCHFCNKLGHWEKECRAKRKQFKQKQDRFKQKNDDEVAFIASTSDVISAPDKDVWIADSGATEHMTSRKEWFSDLCFTNSKRFVYIANNEKLPIKGFGTININALVNGKWIPRVLTNVQYVPQLQQNLFSTGSATNKGFSMLIESNCCVLKDKEENILAMGARDSKNQFRMIFQLRNNQSANSAIQQSLQQWHCRLGHINTEAIKNMYEKKLVNGICVADKRNFFCEDCKRGKMHRSSHKNIEKRVTSKCEYIHMDLCGPMGDAGIGGARYFMLLKDECTRFRYVYFLSHKSEVFEKLKSFFPMERNVTGERVKYIRCDNGKEFINKDITELLAKNGITLEKISPYTPEQNGFIERDNRTVQESARTMLLASGLQKFLWPEAVRTAVYVLNRSSQTNSLTTPFESWFGKKPDLSHIKIFGTECMVYQPKQLGRRKWDAKAKKMFLVGYEPTAKNFRLYDNETKKIIISCDVVFNEKITKLISFEEEKEEELNNMNNEHQISSAQDTSIKTEDTANNIITTPKNSPETVDNVREHQRYTLRKNIVPPQRFGTDYMSCLATIFEPETYDDAMNSEYADKWKMAVEDELDSLELNQTWELVRKPNKKNIIGCKWVFKIKSNPNKEPIFKARLVAKGYSQKAGIDFKETYSPVVRYDSVRAAIALAAAEDMEMMQFDVKTAFLYGDLNEEIYMEIPKGIKIAQDKNFVLRLKKGLYGLKQASRNWNNKFTEFLKKFKMKQSIVDHCVFYANIRNEKTILLLYVDDGLIISSNKIGINLFINELSKQFRITHGESNYYVGLEIHRDRINKCIKISQHAYIEKIIRKFNMDDANIISTPTDCSVYLSKSSDEADVQYPFRQAVGSLMFAAIVSRPDISYAVGEVSKYTENPKSIHIHALKRIFRYLKGTIDYCIEYKFKNSIKFEGYTDADFARDIDTRRSTTGYVFLINDSAVTWRSHRQKTVALSTTEAECMAACEGAKEAIWLQQLLADIGYIQRLPIVLNIDNQGALRLIGNPELHHSTKHIDIRLQFIRDLKRNQTIELNS